MTMVPPLAFQNDVGLSHIANTFRVGVSWSKRLLEWDQVALVSSRTKQVFGHARVVTRMPTTRCSIGRITKRRELCWTI